MSQAKAPTISAANSFWSRGPISRLVGARHQRFPRTPKHLSPSRLLAHRLRLQNGGQNEHRWRPLFEFAAHQRTERLPLMTLQALMRQQNRPDERDILAALGPGDSTEWLDRMQGLAAAGWSQSQLDHWVWILSAPNGDERAERLVSSGQAHPLFLLLLLVRAEEHFRSPSSIAAIISSMEMDHFLLFLRRIINHVRLLSPPSLVSVAHVAASYIRNTPPAMKGYADQCALFNTALVELERHAGSAPFRNREFNWRAQKILLSMSESLERPLIINKESYRAIRRVMIGLEKSGEEKLVVQRQAKTWPPFRLDFDGDDAKRAPEDDHSRSVQAGTLMARAGYVADLYDSSLDTLGGTTRHTPTIQTRDLPPKKGRTEEDDFYATSAATVRATRNAHEAWREFSVFLQHDTHDAARDAKNICAVYAEMFAKLMAANVDGRSSALPGDSKETWPVPEGNYSEFELARQAPPTPAELYSHMRSQGIRPEGPLLHNLVRNAKSVESGLRFLRDAGIETSHLEPGSGEVGYRVARRLTLMQFDSYIELLCRLQPMRQNNEPIEPSRLELIHHAYKLTKARLTANTTEASTFRPPWRHIMRALARQHVAVVNSTRTGNDDRLVAMAVDVLRRAQGASGVGPLLIQYFCRVIEKAAVSRLKLAQSEAHGRAELAEGPGSLVPFRAEVLGILKSFLARVRRSRGRPHDDRGQSHSHELLFPGDTLDASHLHALMRALAFLEDPEAMADLFVWILESRGGLERAGARLGNRGPALMAKTMCVFHAFALPNMDPELQEATEQRVSKLDLDGWAVPSAEDLEAYVAADREGRSDMLRARFRQRRSREAWAKKAAAAAAAGDGDVETEES